MVLVEELTAHGSRQLLRQGAAGILRRRTADEHLPWAVATVAMGSLALDPGLTEPVRNSYTRSGPVNREQDEAEARLSVLSPREQDVLALVGNGLSNRDIAGALNLSPDTVKEHLHRIRAKLGVETRLHAARIAWHAGVGMSHI
ncbi:response regulator transcription factor [Streptomyces sp. KL2]|uniref:response regulator transcription factor n=1 Tax=Streptomyces sp. KL2 TaxID=3050126 RepID=UPI00397E2CFC